MGISRIGTNIKYPYTSISESRSCGLTLTMTKVIFCKKPVMREVLK
jgi:hypothetical protein